MGDAGRCRDDRQVQAGCGSLVARNHVRDISTSSRTIWSPSSGRMAIPISMCSGRSSSLVSRRPMDWSWRGMEGTTAQPQPSRDKPEGRIELVGREDGTGDKACLLADSLYTFGQSGGTGLGEGDKGQILVCGQALAVFGRAGEIPGPGQEQGFLDEGQEMGSPIPSAMTAGRLSQYVLFSSLLPVRWCPSRGIHSSIGEVSS